MAQNRSQGVHTGLVRSRRAAHLLRSRISAVAGRLKLVHFGVQPAILD
jgi:hypothetical protein